MDTQELRNFVTQTPWIIERFRELMVGGGVGYDEVPTFTGFGPKSPLNESMQDMGDMEAAYLGALARYCMSMGTIPQIPLKGFWWVKGQCRGIKGSLDDVWSVVYHLKAYAPEVLETEGVDTVLDAWYNVREYSLKRLPQEVDQWLTLEQASVLVGRATKTVEDWRRAGWVEVLDDRWGVLYSSMGLLTVCKALSDKRTSNLRKVKNI